MKYFNLKSYKLPSIIKNFNFKRYTFKNINFKKLDFLKFYKDINFKKNKFYRKINLKQIKYFLFYFVCIVFLSIIVYLNIPKFFKFDTRSVENLICGKLEVKCVIEGEVGYNSFPLPKLKIKNLVIKNLSGKKKKIITAEEVEVKISPSNLVDKSKLNFTEINFLNAKINLDYEDINLYKNLYKNILNIKPIKFKKSEINFYDSGKIVTKVFNAYLEYTNLKDLEEIILKGRLLEDIVKLEFKKEKNIERPKSNLVLKFVNSDLLTKINFYRSEKKEKILMGDILFKKDKNRLRGTFDYINDKINFKKTDIRNDFLKGNFSGYINFTPFFDINLSINLTGLNFTKFLNLLTSSKSKDLFKFNNKINGKVSLSSEKIHSKYNFFKSFESEIKFLNGNIVVDRFLINLGKLGAADVTGVVNNDKKFSNFKFENNIFIDNEKKLFNKFGIYNKKNISSTLSTSGNFDLTNLKMIFYEIQGKDKLSNEDVNYIEQEFNSILLENNYMSLFSFPKLKEFMKSITPEID